MVVVVVTVAVSVSLTVTVTGPVPREAVALAPPLGLIVADSPALGDVFVDLWIGMISSPVGVVSGEEDVNAVLGCCTAVVEPVASVLAMLVLLGICPDCDSRDRVCVIKVVDTDEVCVMNCPVLLDWTAVELAVTLIWLMTVVAGGSMVTVTSLEPPLLLDVAGALDDDAALDVVGAFEDVAALDVALEEPPPVVPRMLAATAGS